MGVGRELCEDAINLASQALAAGSTELEKRIKRISSQIDQMEKDIESRCLKLLLQQQPVARDLQVISAALKMITDIERIGDQAEDIAEIITYLKGCSAQECAQICQMTEEAQEMVAQSVSAYVRHDTALAEGVLKQDDIVDDYFDTIK